MTARTAALPWAMALLAACATPPPAPDALSGRLAVAVAAHPPTAERRFQGAFELRGDGERGELDLTTPVGLTLARARWHPGAVELTTSEGTVGFASLAELAARTFGEPLPLAAVLDWLRGRPWPQAPYTPRALGFEQIGWSVDLSAYAEGKVTARREAAPAVTLTARVEVPR